MTDGKCRYCQSYNFKAVVQGCKVIEARCNQCGQMADLEGMNPRALIGPAHNMMTNISYLKELDKLSPEEAKAIINEIEYLGCYFMSEIYRCMR